MCMFGFEEEPKLATCHPLCGQHLRRGKDVCLSKWREGRRKGQEEPPRMSFYAFLK